MSIELKILLLAACFILVFTRVIYLIAASWKWDRMVMHYLTHIEDYYTADALRSIAKDCNEIGWKPWIWADLRFWGPAEELYDNALHPRRHFEIVSHWNDVHEQ